MLVQVNPGLSKFRGASGTVYTVLDGKANLDAGDAAAAIGAGFAVELSASSGGGGGGDASAANQVAGNTILSNLLLAVDSVEGNQGTQSTAIGAVNETAPASDIASSGLNGRLQRVAQRLTSLIALLPSALTGGGNLKTALLEALPAGEAHIGQVGGTLVMATGTLTRPADTNAYAAGDAIANSTTAPTVNALSGCARINNGSGMIVKAWLIDSANQAAAAQFEVWVFTASHTLANDNAAVAFTDSDCANVVSIIPMSSSYVGLATVGAGGNRVYESDALNHPFVCSGGGTTLYWSLVARNAYTPVSAEAFTLKLAISQD